MIVIDDNSTLHDDATDQKQEEVEVVMLSTNKRKTIVLSTDADDADPLVDTPEVSSIKLNQTVTQPKVDLVKLAGEAAMAEFVNSEKNTLSDSITNNALLDDTAPIDNPLHTTYNVLTDKNSCIVEEQVIEDQSETDEPEPFQPAIVQPTAMTTEPEPVTPTTLEPIAPESATPVSVIPTSTETTPTTPKVSVEEAEDTFFASMDKTYDIDKLPTASTPDGFDIALSVDKDTIVQENPLGIDMEDIPLIDADSLKVNLTPSDVMVPLSTAAECDEYISSYIPSKDNDDEYIVKRLDEIRDESNYKYRQVFARNVTITPQREQNADAVKQAVDRGDLLGTSVKMEGKVYGDKIAKLDLSKYETGTVISGEDATKFVLSLNQGWLKTYLYGSGFFVVTRPALLHELQNYLVRCRSNTFEFGKVLGQLAYIPYDSEIKKLGIALFKSLIVSCNLKDWNIGDNFEKALSSSDVDSCMWAIAAMMFQNGTEVDFVCHADKCRHIDKVTVDLRKMRIINYSRLGKDALAFVYSSSVKTPEELADYHNNLLKDHKVVELNNNWKLKIGIPSFYDAQTDSEAYITDMTNDIQLTKEKDVTEYVQAKYYRAFAAFIDSATYTATDTGKTLHMKSKAHIPALINALQLEDLTLAESIIDFIQSSKTAHICYIYTKCPKCNTVPSIAANGYIACDVQQSFFILTQQRLKQTQLPTQTQL